MGKKAPHKAAAPVHVTVQRNRLPKRIVRPKSRTFIRGVKGQALAGTKTHWRKVRSTMTRAEFLQRFV